MYTTKTYIIFAIAVILFVALIFLLIKYNKEHYNCNPVVPLNAKPQNMPPSAYAQLVQPQILSSANNPPTSPNFNYINTVNSQVQNTNPQNELACNTPWSQNCVNNDACAMFGVGESCSGPVGNQFCVCQSSLKNGKPVESGKKVKANDVVVGVGGVCTNNEQCCTNYCGKQVGQFSKLCKCPSNLVFNNQELKCECPVGTFLDHKEINCLDFWSDIGECVCPEGYDLIDGKCVLDSCVDLPKPLNDKICETSGKLCGSTSECSLGEYCDSNGQCLCMVTNYEQNNQYGTFLGGANCSTDDQCAHNMVCTSKNSKTGFGICNCPEGLYYNNDLGYKSWYCTCPDSRQSVDPLTKKCTNNDDFKRALCPSTLDSPIKKSQAECGLGELFNPVTGKCYCGGDVHTGKIFKGANCINNQQCELGNCVNGKCAGSSETNFQMAESMYPF